MQSLRGKCFFARIACGCADLSIFGLGSRLWAQPKANPYAGLLQNSPFGMEVAVPAIEPTVEFRGYVSEGGEYLFSLSSLDATGRVHSTWVRLNEPYADCVVRSFDHTSETVQVDRHGRTLILKLSLNRVQLSPSEGGMAVEGADKTRLEAMVAEMARRRAFRQAAKTENHDSDQP